MAIGTGITTQGTTIGISTDGLAYTTIGCITKFGIERGTRSEIDTTCLTDTIKSSRRGIQEQDKLSLDMFFDRGAGLTLVDASFASDTDYFFEIAYSDATTATFQGYVMTPPNQDAEIDGVITSSMEVKITTAITVV